MENIMIQKKTPTRVGSESMAKQLSYLIASLINYYSVSVSITYLPVTTPT